MIEVISGRYLGRVEEQKGAMVPDPIAPLRSKLSKNKGIKSTKLASIGKKEYLCTHDEEILVRFDREGGGKDS